MVGGTSIGGHCPIKSKKNMAIFQLKILVKLLTEFNSSFKIF